MSKSIEIYLKTVIKNHFLKIGQNFAILAHSEKCNWSKIIFALSLVPTLGRKYAKHWLKNVFEQPVYRRYLTEIPLWADISKALPLSFFMDHFGTV
jgi:hypothetical protein